MGETKTRPEDKRSLGRTREGAERRDLFVCFAKQRVQGSRQQTLRKPGFGVRVADGDATSF